MVAMTEQRIGEIARALMGDYNIPGVPDHLEALGWAFVVRGAVTALGDDRVELLFTISDGIQDDEVDAVTNQILDVLAEISPLPDSWDRLLFQSSVERLVQHLRVGFALAP
jgi:hypothetical protein